MDTPRGVRPRGGRRTWSRPLAAVLALVASTSAAPAEACDVCAVYTATELREGRTGFAIGVAEQFSRFGTLRDGGDEVANPFDEKIDSSITQLVFGYAPLPDLLFQVNVPILSRHYRRVEDGLVETGSESGLGDLSLLAQYAVWSTQTEESVVRFTVLGGIKLPTGDSDRLGDELEHHEEAGPEDAHGAEEAHALSRRALTLGQSVRFHDGEHHEEIRSGVHGHDLALGSGSIDGIVGARVFASRDRAFLAAQVQYAIRSEGDFDYEYADDLTWSGGPGYFLRLEHDWTLGLQGVLSGETKSKDEQKGERLDDSAITALYAGPGLLFTWGSSLGLEIAGDLPVIQSNTSLQIVPDYRIRGGASWRF